MAADTDKTGTISVRNLFDFIRKMSNEIKEAASGGIPLQTLNPNTNGDGKIEEWENEVYARIVAADTDHTGAISVHNLFNFIRSMSNEVEEAAKGGIPIATLNPDTDGDGKVEK